MADTSVATFLNLAFPLFPAELSVPSLLGYVKTMIPQFKKNNILEFIEDPTLKNAFISLSFWGIEPANLLLYQLSMHREWDWVQLEKKVIP